MMVQRINSTTLVVFCLFGLVSLSAAQTYLVINQYAFNSSCEGTYIIILLLLCYFFNAHSFLPASQTVSSATALPSSSSSSSSSSFLLLLFSSLSPSFLSPSLFLMLVCSRELDWRHLWGSECVWSPGPFILHLQCHWCVVLQLPRYASEGEWEGGEERRREEIKAFEPHWCMFYSCERGVERMTEDTRW